MEKLYKEDLVDLINDIQHPVWIYNPENYRFLAVNKSALKLLGYSHQELLHMSVMDIRSTSEILHFQQNNEWKVYSYGQHKYQKLVNKAGNEIFAGMSFKNILYSKKNAVITTLYDLTEIINFKSKLAISEERFRISQEISLYGFLILKSLRNDKREITDFAFEYINPVALKYFQLDSHNVIGNKLLDLLGGRFPELFFNCVEVIKSGEALDTEMHNISNGSLKWYRYMIVKIQDRVAVSLLDITHRKLQQFEIEAKNKELHDIVERISDAFIALDKNWNIVYLNDTALRILNSDLSVVGRNFFDAFPLYKDTPVEEYYKKAMHTQQPIKFEVEGKLTPRWYRVSIYPSPEGLSIYSVDTTLSRAYEEHLMSSLKQKVTLLKEVHHRIKNNLQIIISILNLQSYYISDPRALEIFKQSQNRIRSMALIHEKLYKTEDLSSINLENYVIDIVKYLKSTYAVQDDHINVIFDMENIELDSNTAISFGLIVNELVSNSLKYAFPPETNGTVNIRARKNDTKIIFEVSDNGKGFPRDFDLNDTNSLGLQLVNTLTDQLNGELKLESNNGTKFEILIPYVK